MRTVLTVDATRHLRVIEVGVHESVRVQEPGVDELGDALRVDLGAVESPCERVVEHGVREAVEVSDVIY